jgi:hypothetical protein
MAIPSIRSWQSTSAGTSNVSSYSLVAPSGIQAGDLLLALCSSRADYFGTAPYNTISGWTRLLNRNGQESYVDGPYEKAACFYKIATGGEGNITVTSIDNFQHVGFYVCIKDVDTTNPILASKVSTFGNFDSAAASYNNTGLDCGTETNVLMVQAGASRQTSDPYNHPFNGSTGGYTLHEDVYSGLSSGKALSSLLSRTHLTGGVSPTNSLSYTYPEAFVWMTLAILGSSKRRVLIS